MAKELKADTLESVLEEPAKKEPKEKKETKETKSKASEEPKAETPAKKRGRPRKKRDESLPAIGVKLKDMTEEEQLLTKMLLESRSIAKASKKERSEMYKQPSVIPDPDYGFAESEADLKRKEWNELASAAYDTQNPVILKGKVWKVSQVKTNKDEDDPRFVPQYMLDIKYGNGYFKVKIPAYAVYDYDINNYNQQMAEEVNKNLSRRVGADIKFVVAYADEKTQIVYADRLRALALEGNMNYASLNNKRPRVVPGELVTARILGASRTKITVEALGAEIDIPLEEISYLHISDARHFDGIQAPQDYTTGKLVNIKILDVKTKEVIKHGNKYKLIDAQGSIKQAYANPRRKYFDDYEVGDICCGTIAAITDSGIFVNFGDMDCICKPPKNGTFPILGETAKVRINQKDEENLFLFGTLYK